MFHFIWPQMLWLAPLAIGFVIARRVVANKRYERLLAGWGQRTRRGSFAPQTQRWRKRLFDGLLATALLSGVFALARPSWQSSNIRFPVDATMTVAVLDDSVSMGAKDSGDPSNPTTRLKTACESMRLRIIPQCEGNLFGLVTYAGQAYPQALPTRQLKTALHFLKRIKISDAPGEGSSMSRAFHLAFKYFDWAEKEARKRGETVKGRKVLILWSDGGTDEKDDLDAIIKGCNERGIQLLVFGVGDVSPARIPVSELPRSVQMRSRGEFLEMNQEVVQTALEEQPLMKLQQGTAVHGSRYQRVRMPSDVDLERLVSGVEMETKTGEQEWFLAPVLILIACLVAAEFVQTRRRTLPRRV